MPSATKLKVLIVEDDADDAEMMVVELRRSGFDVESRRVENEDDYRQQLFQMPDVILCDYSLPQFDALRAIGVLEERGLDTPCIVITGAIGDEAAAECMRHGAADYIIKDRPFRLGPAVEQALEKKRTKEEHRVLQTELLEARKLESVGRLASGIAHDFNNMLTAIMGFSELMTLRCELDANASSYLNYISSASAKAHNLCQQLLAFAREQLAEPRSVDLNSLILELEPMLRPQLGDEVELKIVQETPLHFVQVDPQQFEQILVNLVVNARDAIATTGSITIQTQNVALDAGHESGTEDLVSGDCVLLTVTDTGSGMDETTRRHVFEPFFTTKKAGSGTGLGLATTYGIVKQAMGHITLWSELGYGTSVRIYLPKTSEPLSTPLPQLKLEYLGGSETILLAEHDPAVRALALESLEGLGYRVIEAASGDEAAEAVSNSCEIDLLITDAAMSLSDGTELAQRLRHANPILKVIYASGHTRESIQQLRGETNDIHCLARPFTPSVLAHKVREVLNN